MKTYNISEARENFTAVVKLAEDGEEVQLLRHGKPVVSLRPVAGDRPEPGFMLRRGWQVKMAPDFDTTPEDFAEYTGPDAQR